MSCLVMSMQNAVYKHKPLRSYVNDGTSSSSEDHVIDGLVYSCFGQFECFFCGIDSLMDRGRSELTGKLLTLVDSSVVDPRQNKAMKDMVSQIVMHTFFNASNGPGDSNIRRTSVELLGRAIKHEYDVIKNVETAALPLRDRIAAAQGVVGGVMG